MQKEFERFFKEQQSRVYRVVLSYTRKRAIAEELTLEAMMIVYERWERVKKFENAAAYLMRIAVNLSKRSLKRGRRNFISVESVSEITDDRHPEREMLLKEENRRVEDALSHLSDKERQVIVLKDVEGLKMREVSDIVRLKLTTVKSLYRRGKLKLAKDLEAENA